MTTKGRHSLNKSGGGGLGGRGAWSCQHDVWKESNLLSDRSSMQGHANGRRNDDDDDNDKGDGGQAVVSSNHVQSPPPPPEKKRHAAAVGTSK